MKRYLPSLAAFCAALCLISAPFVGAMGEQEAAPARDSVLPVGEELLIAPVLARGKELSSLADNETVPASGAVLRSASGSFPEISARCAIVTDPEAGAVLYEKEAHRRCLIASTTKIMTGYLACRLLDPETVYTVPDSAVGVEGSSMYLQKDEQLTGRELLLGLMLHSGNDAATALAILCDGDEAAFVQRMNREAEALGLENTHFANPHGLDSQENYSTARDLAALTAAAMREPLFAQLVSTRQAQAAGRTLTNHNRLLWSCEGCVGVKTGYTQAAGRILVSAVRRGGRLLICVTLDDPDDWSDHLALYEQAFSQYHDTPVARAGEELLRLKLGAAGLAGELFPDSPVGTAGLPLTAEEDFSLLLLPGEELSYRFLPLPEDPENSMPLFVPGAPAGRVEILVDGRFAGTVPVLWGED